MKIKLFSMFMLISMNTWAGNEVQRCGDNSSESPIKICFEWTRLTGKLQIAGEKIKLQFPDETQPSTSFVLSATNQIGTIRMTGFEAIIQIDNDKSILLTCESIKPGTCSIF